MSNNAYLLTAGEKWPRSAAPTTMLAWARYIVPVGWMIPFEGEKLRTHESEQEGDFVYFQTSITRARKLLSAAITAFRSDAYFESRFGAIEGLSVALSKSRAPRLIADISEIYWLSAAASHKRALSEAPARCGELVARIEKGGRQPALRYFESSGLDKLGGMRLTGDEQRDRAVWKRTLRQTGIATPQELCAWWTAGVIGNGP